MRVRFLEKVLYVKRGLHGDALARDFETFEKDFEMERPQWLQRHLAAYYAGLVWEGTGMTDEAIAAYRRCLDICPNHLWSLEHLAAIDSSLLTQEERDLLDLVKSRLSPIAMATSSLHWVAISVTPEKLAEIFEPQNVEYIFLCVSEVRDHLKLNMMYEDKNGFIFSDRIEMGEGMEYTIRVGELLRIERSDWHPYNLTLTSRRRVIANGEIIARLGKFAVKAFDVDIKGTTKEKPSVQ